VKRAGAPTLSLEGAGAAPIDGKGRAAGEVPWKVTGRVVQEGEPWPVRVPVVLEGSGQRERTIVETAKGSAAFEVVVPFRPETLRVDPEQDVFRRLDPAEIPPVLSLLLGDPKTLFVVDDGAAPEAVKAYREMATTLTRTGEGEVADASRVEAAALAGRTVFFLGYPAKEALAKLLAGLPKEVEAGASRFAVQGTEYKQEGAALLVVGRKPDDPARGFGVFLGLSPDAIRAAGRKLVHYGKYSFLAFVDGTNKAKGVARVDGGPLVYRFEAAAK
jgi:hypothetical protein